MADNIIARKDARAQGLPRYMTGKPCKYGHIAERYTVNLTCVVCDLDKTRARQWHIHNRDRHREHNRRWSKKNPQKKRDYAKRVKEQNPNHYKDRWNAIDPELRKSRKRAWYAANRDHAIQYNAQWARDNPEHAKELKALIARRRRFRKAGAVGSHTRSDLRAILELQNHRCVYCAVDLRKSKKHVDHIIPLARGGSDDKSNLQYLCQPCNLAKGAKDPLQFAQELGRLL